MADEQNQSTFFREKRKIYYLAFLVMAIFIGIFWFWRVYLYPFESTQDAILQAPDIAVSPVVAGQIVKMTIDEGSVVKRGDLLFILDDTVLRFQKEKAIAAIQHVQDEVQVERIRRQLALDEYTRAKTQFEADVISQEMMTHVQKNLEMAGAVLQSVLSMVEVQLADLRMIEKQMQLCRVIAPSDGVVAKVWHIAGDVIQAGQTVLTMMDLLDLWVDANIEETKISAIHIGDTASLTVDAYPNLNFSGNVLVVGAAAASQFALIPSSNSSGNFIKVTQRVPLKISLKIPEETSTLYLRPGMSVQVKIRAR